MHPLPEVSTTNLEQKAQKIGREAASAMVILITLPKYYNLRPTPQTQLFSQAFSYRMLIVLGGTAAGSHKWESSLAVRR
jgi:hypothetical protein